MLDQQERGSAHCPATFCLQPARPCPSLLWDPCSFGRYFSSASGWVEWVGGTVVSHRSVHQQPAWVILNRKLPTSQRERFVLIPPDLCPECQPSLTCLPLLQFSSPVLHRGLPLPRPVPSALAAGLSASLGTLQGWSTEAGM